MTIASATIQDRLVQTLNFNKGRLERFSASFALAEILFEDRNVRFAMNLW